MLAALKNIKMLSLIPLTPWYTIYFHITLSQFWKKNNHFHLVYPKFIIDISIIRKTVQNFVTIQGTF